MPISHSAWYKSLDFDAIGRAFEAEEAREAALSPKQRAAEKDMRDARAERVRKHIAFLDYCVANKIKPGLVLPVPKHK